MDAVSNKSIRQESYQSFGERDKSFLSTCCRRRWCVEPCWSARQLPRDTSPPSSVCRCDSSARLPSLLLGCWPLDRYLGEHTGSRSKLQSPPHLADGFEQPPWHWQDRAPYAFSKWCAPNNSLSHVTILLQKCFSSSYCLFCWCKWPLWTQVNTTATGMTHWTGALDGSSVPWTVWAERLLNPSTSPVKLPLPTSNLLRRNWEQG